MTEPPSLPAELDDIDGAILARVSDYLDGALGADERAEVERKIASEVVWRRAHGELTETRTYLSGLRNAHAPSSFSDGVARTIHQRSAGRLFGRRTLGDRVPFGAVLVVALIVLIALGYVLWGSATGSLKIDRDPRPPRGSAVAPP